MAVFNSLRVFEIVRARVLSFSAMLAILFFVGLSESKNQTPSTGASVPENGKAVTTYNVNQVKTFSEEEVRVRVKKRTYLGGKDEEPMQVQTPLYSPLKKQVEVEGGPDTSATD